MATTHTSLLAQANEANPAANDVGSDVDSSVSNAFALPIETEIYVLPDGQVVIADMPTELAELAAQIGNVEPCSTPAVTGPSVPRFPIARASVAESKAQDETIAQSGVQPAEKLLDHLF